jgi:hypothetical protein
VTKEPSIPLRSPDGIVYAWACGACHHVQHPGEMMGPLGPEDVARTAEHALVYADRCCTCASCGGRKPWEEKEDEGKVPLGVMLRRLHPSGQWCAACEARERPIQEARDKRVQDEAAAFGARAAASLARSADPIGADMIASTLREISEDCYAASWLSGVEFDIWEMLPTQWRPYRDVASREFGMSDVPEETIAKLRELHEKAGGWWQWQKDEGTICAGGPVFVTTEEWLAIVAARKAEP